MERRSVGATVEGGTTGSGGFPHWDPDSGLLHGGHGGLHSASFKDAVLALEVAGGFELQTFKGPSRDAGAPAKGLFETSTEPVVEKHQSVASRWSQSTLSV